MKKIFLFFILSFTIIFACKRKNNPPPPPQVNNISDIPDGSVVVIANRDFSNLGLQVNKHNTKVIIEGSVIVDDLSVIGELHVAPGAELTVRGLTNISGGAKMKISGLLKTNDLTLVGDVFFDGANVTVTNQYTSGGGTKTYFQNSILNVRDLRVTGDLIALENDFVTSSNKFSAIQFLPNHFYNRGGGTRICGPLLFTSLGTINYMNDLVDKTADVLILKPSIRSIYKLPENNKLYQHKDVCAKTSIATGF